METTTAIGSETLPDMRIDIGTMDPGELLILFAGAVLVELEKIERWYQGNMQAATTPRIPRSVVNEWLRTARHLGIDIGAITAQCEARMQAVDLQIVQR